MWPASRGMMRIGCSSNDNPKISSLLDGMAQYMNWNKTMMEITQRNSGNGNKEALYFLY